MTPAGRFVRLQRPSLHGVASAYAVGLALLIPYGGVGHTVAVTAVHVRAERPYDLRFASLLATGGVLIYGAVTNLVLARWIGQGRAWAIAWSMAVTGAVAAFTALLLAVPAARDAAGPAFVLNISYVALLIVVFAATRLRTSRAE